MTKPQIAPRDPPYQAARKYRAVLSMWFDRGWRAEEGQKFILGIGGTAEDAEGFFPSPPRNDERAFVAEAIQWVFGPREIRAGRFNDNSYPALYTAKEPQTAVKELGKEDLGQEYVVFDLLFTGTGLDMRPPIDREELRWPMEHDECQPIAAAAREVADSLVCYSAPFPDEKRSCCAIFKPDGVEPGEVVIRGIL